jgi:hypothetical protein
MEKFTKYLDKEGNVLENVGVSEYITGPYLFALYVGQKVKILSSSVENKKIYYNIKIDESKNTFWVLSGGNSKIEYNRNILYEDIEILNAYNPETQLSSTLIVCPFNIEKMNDIINHAESEISKGKIVDYGIDYL